MVKSEEELLNVENLKVIGKGYEDGYVRPEDVKRVTGTAVFSHDQRPYNLGYPKSPNLKGVLEAKLLRSPVAHANINRVDTSTAEAMDGVEAVITGEDAVLSDEYVHKWQPQRKKVHHVGDVVAAVAAEDRLTAQNAVEEIEVDYDPLPTVLDPEEAVTPEEFIYSPDDIQQSAGGEAFVEENFPLDEPTAELEFGNLESAFNAADSVVESKYKGPTVNSITQERRNAIAEWHGKQLTFWVTSQQADLDAGVIAGSFGMSKDDIRIICPFLGGGWGGAGTATTSDDYFILSALLAKKADKPVRLQFTRRGQSMVEGGRAVPVIESKIGVTNDGEITAIDEELIWDQGEMHNDFTMGRNEKYLLATTPRAFRWKASRVFTNRVNTYMRGYGNTMQGLVRQQVIDEAAAEIGMDPLDIHRVNHAHFRPAEAKTVPDRWLQKWSTKTEEMIEAVADSLNWDQKWKPPEKRDGRIRRGLGFSMFNHGDGNWPRTVSIHMDGSGEIWIDPDMTEHGVDCYDASCKAVAEVLQVEYESIRRSSSRGDTKDHTGIGFHEADSGTRSIIGPYKDVALKLRGKLIDGASNLLDADPDEFSFEDRKAKMADGSDEVTYAEIAQAAGGFHVWLDHERGGSNYYPLMAATEVEVDTQTGIITPIKHIVAKDVGKVVNDEHVVKSQLEGASIQSIGYVLWPDARYDKESGVMLNADLHKLGKPTHENLRDFEIETLLYESSDSLANWEDNVQGIGEHGNDVSVGPVANAVYNATGVRFYEYPLTPDRVLPRLEEEGVTPF